MMDLLAGLSGRRRLTVALALACSILLHLAVFGIGVFMKGLAPTFAAKKGDTLFVELPKPEEEAASPGALGSQPAPSAPKALAQAPKAPAPKAQARPAQQRVAPPEPKAGHPTTPSRTSEPIQVAKAQTAEPEEPQSPTAPSLTPEQKSQPSAAPEAQAEARAAPGRAAVASLPKEPGAGGAGQGGLQVLRRGRGGIEGDPIPLDTPDPRYSDYFKILKRQIQEKWVYPREAGDRGLGGQLVIEFVIAKSGHLEAIDLRRSSGVEILDRFALNAVKLAQPFPPVPDSLGRDRLPISGLFNYVVNVGFVNHFLR